MLNKLKKFTLSTLMVAACVATMGISALAGDSYTKYDTTVGAFNGSGYSGSQKKETSGANGRVISSNVSGDYKVDVRMQKTDSTANGKWFYDIDDNTDTGYKVDGHKNQMHNSKVRLQFSNDLTTPKKVDVTGEWSSQ